MRPEVRKGRNVKQVAPLQTRTSAKRSCWQDQLGLSFALPRSPRRSPGGYRLPAQFARRHRSPAALGRIGLSPADRLSLPVADRHEQRADVAQLVAHHLAKVRVAGSNPVVRSEGLSRGLLRWSGREARQRPAKPSTRVRIPSPPRQVGCGSLGLPFITAPQRAIGAVWLARFPDTEEVTGSSPVSPTIFMQVRGLRGPKIRGRAHSVP